MRLIAIVLGVMVALQSAAVTPLDPVAPLNGKLRDGSLSLTFDNTFGYLPAALDALKVPKESQLLVFSKTSLQAALISPANPRAIFFNDAVAIAWVRGGAMLELAVQDPQQGIAFYTLDQARQTRPAFLREDVCLSCHRTAATLDLPGILVRTVFPKDTGAQVAGLIGSQTDHRTPFDERWGGWYATGKHGPLRHLANAVVGSVQSVSTAAAPAGGTDSREPLPEKFSTTGYMSPTSDVVALAVFEHQAHMMNLISRVGALARTGRVPDAVVQDFVDYLLFVKEAPFTAKIEGTSGFAEKFSAQGPFDSKGRSLRQFDLERRLMRYPCSYMIYSDAFTALPPAAKDAIYARMRQVLSAEANDPGRRAVSEILRDTLNF